MEKSLNFSQEVRGKYFGDEYYAARSGVLGILGKKSGIRLDLGCGANKNEGFVGIDVRALEGVDIVWDLERTPYPLPDECCSMIVGSHIIEHISPRAFLAVMDELWRLLQPKAQLALALPYAGSPGYWQDPTHVNGCNEATWQYFDPRYPLYRIYEPKPWFVEVNAWQRTGNMEVVLRKLMPDEADELRDAMDPEKKTEKEDGNGK